MSEYVFSISRRNPSQPLGMETPIVEFGVDSNKAQEFLTALEQIVALLKMLKTPEAVAKFMQENTHLSETKNLKILM